MAQGGGGASPVLARYQATGEVLRLVDWAIPDSNARSSLTFDVDSERLYAAVAYQMSFQNGGTLALSVDHPAPIPVGVGMVPDLAYENGNPGKYGYLLQIRGVTLERAYESDYWQTLLPVVVTGHDVTITGARGLVTLTAPADCAIRVDSLPLLDGSTQRRIVFARAAVPGVPATLAVEVQLRPR